MFNIIVNTNQYEKQVGKASCKAELEPLLNDLEIKVLVRADAWLDLDQVFKAVKMGQKKDSYIMNYNSINISVISNGYDIKTLVFYL